jgi:rSAM/selenodomain-associated transferase 2/rSAM/selenodomain-associated transferase 1
VPVSTKKSRDVNKINLVLYSGMKKNDQLILFTRFPQPGKTKTRLIPHLGEEGAAGLQREMTEHTIRQARKTGVPIEVRYTGSPEEPMRQWLGADLEYEEQGGGDLGERMKRACDAHFENGADRVVLIGSDCPSNDWRNLNEAFQALETNECVIGPASDGGYYLIGLCRAGAETPPPRSWTAAALFQNIDWGGEQVLEQTLKAASGLSVRQLPKLDDVDLPEDIPAKISVIIPALNEAKQLPNTLELVRDGFNVEVIVVDGGSTDGTRLIAPETLTCLQGRAAQQNTGARAATGELFLFLHADTELPDCWDGIIRETLSDPSVALGAFSFKVKEQMRGLKFVEDTVNWRSRARKQPYGDQGLFMRRATFEQAGGFPDMPIMEDYALVRSLRRLGKIITVPEAALTSGRRWRQHGMFKVTAVNKLMILGYHLGVSLERLAAFYRK